MNPQIRKYWAIIVHFGSPEPTNASLDAMYGGVDHLDGVIIVNNSKEDFQTTNHPRCTTVNPGKNLGYAGAIRVGLGALVAQGVNPSDIVICMNNDVLVGDNTIADVKEWWSDHSSPALLGIPTIEGGKEFSGLGRVNFFSGRALVQPSGVTEQPQNIFSMNYIHGAIFSAPYSLLLN